MEFGSLPHQLGAELVANPFSTNLHKILLEIAPDGKDRLPKRQPKAPPKPVAPPPELKKGKKPAVPEKPKAPDYSQPNGAGFAERSLIGPGGQLASRASPAFSLSLEEFFRR